MPEPPVKARCNGYWKVRSTFGTTRRSIASVEHKLSDSESTDLPRVSHWTWSQRASVWRHVVPVVEGNDEDLNGRRYSWMPSTWGSSPTMRGYDRYPSVDCTSGREYDRHPSVQTFGREYDRHPSVHYTSGRGYDRHPSVDCTLGESGSCQDQPCSRSLKNCASRITCGTSSLNIRSASVNGEVQDGSAGRDREDCASE